MSKKTVALTIIGLLFGSAILFAGCGYHKFRKASPEKKAEYIVKHVADELDLTDEQIVKVNVIKDEVLAKFKPLRAEKAKMHKKVIDLITSDELDKNVVLDLMDKRHEKMKQLRPFIAEKIIDLHKILTSEQRQELADKLTKMHKRWHK